MRVIGRIFYKENCIKTIRFSALRRHAKMRIAMLIAAPCKSKMNQTSLLILSFLASHTCASGNAIEQLAQPETNLYLQSLHHLYYFLSCKTIQLLHRSIFRVRR